MFERIYFLFGVIFVLFPILGIWTVWKENIIFFLGIIMILLSLYSIFFTKSESKTGKKIIKDD